MTKVGLSCKSQKLNDQQCRANDNSASKNADGNINKEKQPKNQFEHVLNTLVLKSKCDDGPYIGMDWSFILKIASTQAMLSIILMVFLLMSIFLVNLYRIKSFLWLAYLFACACFGLRAARWQSYSHAIAYCIMCTIQSFFYTSIVYSVLDDRISIHILPWNPMLGIALGEGLCLLGTIFTGILGLIGCCRGFGRLFYAQEKMMLDYQNAVVGAYNNACQLNPV